MWQNKAHRIIAEASLRAFETANRGRKRHVAYRVPQWVTELIGYMDADNEVAAKHLFQRHAMGWLK